MVHTVNFVRLVGCRAKLGEEGFKHYQSTFAYIRNQYSHNLAAGGQI